MHCPLKMASEEARLQIFCVTSEKMLLKVKYKGEQKFVKIDVKLPELFDSAFRKFGIAIGRLNEAKLFDSTRTEIDDDVFEEVVTSNHQHVYELCLDGTPGDFDAEMSVSRESSILEAEPDTIILNVESPMQFTSDNTAHSLIEDILKNKPGGDQILREYRRTNKLTDSTRRKLVNMVVANMTEIHGTSPSRSVRELHAKGIVQLFPQLKDPFSEKGYEHFYDSDSGTGFIAWRLKTLQKRAAEDQQSVSWAKYFGTEYRINLICTEVLNDMPVFQKIDSIVVKDDNVFLIVKKLDTVCFDEHVYAFNVAAPRDDIFNIIDVNVLLYFKPFDLQMAHSEDSKYYIVPYCHFL